MKLTPPELFSKDPRRENRYLTHCNNIALILTHTESVAYGKARIAEYFRITNTNLNGEENGQEPLS